MTDVSDSEESASRSAMALRSPLGHHRRRAAVRCLARANESIHAADLARDVARLERPGGHEAERIYVELYHIHLPKLAEDGVVSFDPESKLVSATADGPMACPGDGSGGD